MRDKRLCLNMIVKNESRVIRRLLNSVVSLIDCYCICDTGSTDNTIDVITGFFDEHNIPGVVLYEAFRDFGYNRTYALKACENIDVRYILLLDADMVLKHNIRLNADVFYQMLTNDVYHMYQGSESFYYKNVRIVRNKMGITYWGVTHEYVNTPPNTVYGTIDKSVLFINDIGDGGSKTDKFERDIALLKKGLEEHPNNDRYTFYLANSYKDAGQIENAIETYKKRITLGGWYEEIWYSCYTIGRCYQILSKPEYAIFWFLQAHNVIPERIENLYEIIHYYRNHGKNTLAYSFYVMAHDSLQKNKSPDYLFLQKDVYEYKLEYELSIVGYYCNYKQYDMRQCCMNVLDCAHTEDSIATNVMSNYKFYTEDIARSKEVRVDDAFPLGKLLRSVTENTALLDKLNTEFVGSTPSMVSMKNGKMAVNVRYVNYRITDNGGYQNGTQIKTVNVFAIVDTLSMEIVRDAAFLEYDRTQDDYYVGLEDVRLFYDASGETVYFNANRGMRGGGMAVEHGYIDLTEKYFAVSRVLRMDGQRHIEKNWVLYCNDFGALVAIYQWYPLVFGVIENGEFKRVGERPTPHSFKHLRGSTNGCRLLHNEEVWFLCHAVSYEDRRYYYHMWVVIDARSNVVVKYSPFFTFQREKVEYALGLVYCENEDAFCVGYSIMDRETHYIQIPRKTIESTMRYAIKCEK